MHPLTWKKRREDKPQARDSQAVAGYLFSDKSAFPRQTYFAFAIYPPTADCYANYQCTPRISVANATCSLLAGSSEFAFWPFAAAESGNRLNAVFINT